MKTCPSCRQSYPTHFVVCPQDGRALVESGVWSEGTVVREKYRLLGQIGSGGMATVYKAEHIHFGELCALKAISLDLATDAGFVRRFVQEAVLTRRLKHPNAVRVEDIDKAEDGRPFMVMEYIEGRSLKDVIQQEAPMAVARVCSIAKQVAAALDAAHRLGMVHRDIKPANILLVAQGPPSSAMALQEQAKVLDFGIAKIKEGHLEDSKFHQVTLTGTGMLIGTPAYMSPEQAMGKRGEELDGRSDLYSLGVVMYQMLVADLPIKADSGLQLMMAHVHTPPTPILSRRPSLPKEIAGLVMSCLEKSSEGRPPSAKSLIEHIEYWEQEPVREAARERAEQERRAYERAEAERLARLQAEKERLAQEKAEAERLAREAAERERIAREHAAQERVVREMAEAKRRERVEAERLAQVQAEKERLAQERADVERLAREAAERERIAKERAQQERVARERAEAERRARERAEAERLAHVQAEKERLAREKAAAERLAREAAERERIAKERAEQERVVREQAEAKRRERVEAERLAQAAQAERERVAHEKAEAERLAGEAAERDRIARDRAERERRAKKQAEEAYWAQKAAEAARLEQVQAEELELQRVEVERLAAQEAERERLDREIAELDRLARQRIEADLLAAQRAANERRPPHDLETEWLPPEPEQAHQEAQAEEPQTEPISIPVVFDPKEHAPSMATFESAPAAGAAADWDSAGEADFHVRARVGLPRAENIWPSRRNLGVAVTVSVLVAAGVIAGWRLSRPHQPPSKSPGPAPTAGIAQPAPKGKKSVEGRNQALSDGRDQSGAGIDLPIRTSASPVRSASGISPSRAQSAGSVKIAPKNMKARKLARQSEDIEARQGTARRASGVPPAPRPADIAQATELSKRGDAYRDNGQYDQAIAAYQSALGLDPSRSADIEKRMIAAKNAKTFEVMHGTLPH